MLTAGFLFRITLFLIVLPEVQAGFRRGRGTRDQIANLRCIMEKAREFQKNIYFCFIDYAKAFAVWTTANYGKSLKKWEFLTTLSISWEISMWDRKQQLELDLEQLIDSKLGKEYNKAVYCLPAYLTYMQNISCKREDWINPK